MNIEDVAHNTPEKIFKEVIDPAQQYLVLRTQFVFADGSEHLGYMTTHRSEDGGRATSPVVVCGLGQVSFHPQGLKPPSRAELDDCYSRLGKIGASQVFPVRFQSDVPLIGGPLSGVIEGFTFLDDWRSGRTRLLR
jgi:hypothetical protein